MDFAIEVLSRGDTWEQWGEPSFVRQVPSSANVSQNGIQSKHSFATDGDRRVDRGKWIAGECWILICPRYRWPMMFTKNPSAHHAKEKSQ